jgi:zinc D-Ala-D-Ala carboxypeptidase
MHADYPDQIATIHRELGIPADYAKSRGLRLHAEAESQAMVTIAENSARKPIQLIEQASAAWTRMQVAAHGEGITITPLSGFRSVARQVELIRNKLQSGAAIEQVLSIIAAPGYSEHHTGRAIDLGIPNQPPLEESFERTAAFSWLAKHAASYGFHLSFPRNNPHGIVYEPWHWCWISI